MRSVTIAELLGTGGQGEVYGGLLDDGRAVAIKRLGAKPSRQAVRRLVMEARLLSWTAHSGVVRPVALAYVNGEIALLTERAPGANLEQLSQALRPAPGVVLAIGSGIAEILHEASTAPGPDGRPLGLVHRDIRPANIMVGPDGRPRLLDLGVGMAGNARTGETASGQQLGALETMAPEAFMSSDGRPSRDVFALAATLVLVMGRESLYGRRTSRQLAMLAAAPARFEALIHDVLAGVPGAEALKPALVHEPLDRPTAAEFAESLARASMRKGGSAASWARSALAALPPPEDGEWSGQQFAVEPAGFDGVEDLSRDRMRPPVGESDPTERHATSRPDATDRLAVHLPTRPKPRTPLNTVALDQATKPRRAKPSPVAGDETTRPRAIDPSGSGQHPQVSQPDPLPQPSPIAPDPTPSSGLTAVGCGAGLALALLLGLIGLGMMGLSAGPE